MKVGRILLEGVTLGIVLVIMCGCPCSIYPPESESACPSQPPIPIPGRTSYPPTPKHPNSYECLCQCGFEPAALSTQVLRVCMPLSMNRNVNPTAPPPTPSDLASDCAGRVQTTLTNLNEACKYPPCTCSSVANSARFGGSTCDTGSSGIRVASDCGNFDPAGGVVTATHSGSDAPVFTAFSPLAADLFGRRSSCAVAGSSSITAADEDPEDSHTAGIVNFVGDPCPGGSCAARMEYDLGFGSVTFGNIFHSETFSDLAGIGESVPANSAVISPAGDGTFGVNSVGATGQGRREGDLHGMETANQDAINVHVGWGESTPTCRVRGSLIGTVDPEAKRCENAGPDAGVPCEADSDCTNDEACSDAVCNCETLGSVGMTVSMDVAGRIVNQPPAADAGSDPMVECTNAAGTTIVLDGSDSSDPDSNLTIFAWLKGSRAGTRVGLDDVLTIQQPLGGQSYILRVIDASGQADEDTAVAYVVDTLPPVVSCSVATPDLNVTSQTNHNLINVGLGAAAVDQCEGSPAITVRVFGDEDDEEDTGDGRYSPDAKNLAVGSLRLRNERKGSGDGRVYLVVPEASDSSGNRGFACCTVTVPASSKKSALTSVRAQADAVKTHCLAHAGSPPAGYAVIGDGQVIGPKQ